jgi:hypothetical protein
MLTLGVLCGKTPWCCSRWGGATVIDGAPHLQGNCVNTET